MGDFVTRQDLADALGETVDNARADEAIADAEGAVRQFCGWNLTQETVTDQFVEPSGAVIFLPTLHLTSLAVTESGTVLTSGTGYAWYSNGVVKRVNGGCWSSLFQAVKVTYTHGYATGAPQLQAARTAAKSYAIRQYQNAAQMRSETVGGVTDAFAIPTSGVPIGVDLSYSEQNVLASLKLPVLA